MRRSRRTRGLDDLAAEIVRRADPAGRRYGAQAVEAWSEVVGPEIAAHTRGFALRDGGELVVFVDRAVWAAQLAAMSEEIRVRLNAHLGHTKVRAIRFTVSKNVAKEAEWEALSREAEGYYTDAPRERCALDETERAQVEHVVAPISDPGLREIAKRVMTRDLEQRKAQRRRAPGTRPNTDPQGPVG